MPHEVVPSAVEASLQALARRWTEEVLRRRAMSAHDLTADILQHCATELTQALTTASVEDEELSPAEFGALPHINKSASTVRRWCQHGRIECRPVGRDYRIRRGTRPPRLRVA